MPRAAYAVCMTLPAYTAFVGLCALLALTPGPDTFLTLRFSVSRRAAGIASGAGSALGTIVWAGLVAVGLAALLEQSADVYRVVKIVGGLYLIYLGVSAFVRTRRARRTRGTVADASAEPASSELQLRIGRAFGAGLTSTLLNPKVGLFFLAIVPQFVPAHQGTLGWTMLLGLTTALVGGLYLVGVAFVAATAMAWLKRPSVSAWMERISGGILAALGIGTIALSVNE